MRKTYILISSARRLLRLPYGICIFDKPPRSILRLKALFESLKLRGLCTIGDVVTANVTRFWRVPDIAVIDHLTRGAERVSSVTDSAFSYVFHLHQERSSLNVEIEHLLTRSRELVSRGRNVLVKVVGEEDIIAIPAILILEDFLVVYGNYFLDCIVAIPSVGAYRRAVLKLYAQFR